MNTQRWCPSLSSETHPLKKQLIYPLPIPSQTGEAVPATKDVMQQLYITPDSDLIGQLQEPSLLLRNGETVAFPTETVYGLGANALDSDAISKIYTAKGRPSDNPLIVHISSSSQIESLVSYVCPLARRLMGAFWPGPLTIIMPDAGNASVKVTAGLGTIGIRMPDHPIALALIEGSGVPIAAPSANTSGRPSPTTANHVFNDLQGKIAGIVEGPDFLVPVKEGSSAKSPRDRVTQCQFGVESTVVDISHLSSLQDVEVAFNASGELVLQTEGPPLVYILRPGGVTKAMLEAIVGAGRVEFDPTLLLNVDQAFEDSERDQAPLEGAGDLKPRAPGMKYAHYAPNAPLFVVVGEKDDIQCHTKALESIVLKSRELGKKVGVLTTYENEEHFQKLADIVLPCGSRDNMLSVAAQLYDTLRLFDDLDVDVIYSESFSSDELGAAVMNRLLKAAGGKVLRG